MFSSRQLVKVLTAITLASSSTVGFAQTEAMSAGGSSESKNTESSSITKSESSAVEQSQLMALKYLVMAAALRDKVPDSIRIDTKVEEKYNNIRGKFLGAVPASSTASATAYFAKDAAKQVIFRLEFLTTAFRAFYRGSVLATNKLLDLAKLLKLDVGSGKSVEVARISYENLIVPMVKVLVKAHFDKSISAGIAGGTFYSSYSLLANDAKEIIRKDWVRSVLGMNNVIRQRVNELSAGAASVFELTPSQTEILQMAIYDKVLSLAIENKFSEDPKLYSLDLMEVMESKALVSKEVSQGVRELGKIAATLQSEKDQKTVSDIVALNAEVVIQTAKVLESILEKDLVKEAKTKATMEQMLGLLVVQLGRVNFNLKISKGPKQK